MVFTITPIYAALLGLLFIILRTIVTIERAKSGISILTQDNMVLAEKVRRFGNFIETVPFVIILMAFVESFSAPTMVLHLIGSLLLISRLLHPIGLDHTKGAHPLRIASGMATLVSVLICVVYLLWRSFV